MQQRRAAGVRSRAYGPVLLPAAVAVGAVVAGRVSAAPVVWWDVAWTAAAVSALVGLLLARRSAEPSNRGRWTLWAGAAGCWLAGQLAWDAFGVLGSARSPNLADIGWWGFALLVMEPMARIPVRSRFVRVVAAAETLPLIAAAVALTFAELWPVAAASSLPVMPRISALVYPAVYVSAAVLTLQAMVGGSLISARSPASRLVLGGVALEALAFTLWSKQLLEQSYVTGKSLLDPLWVLGLIAIAAGGALAARRPEPSAPVDEPSHRGGFLPAGMFLLLLAALVWARLSHAADAVALTLDAGLLFSGGALILRSALLERRLRALLDRERAARVNLAEREVELARLNERLVEDSRRDPLTGMRNRRALSDDLPTFEAIRQERGDSFALALCDVDRFKAYNDRLGHLAGDQALRAIAATVRGALRAGDAAYRFGGEELLLVLQNATARDALAAAERVRAAVEVAALPHPDGLDGVLTVSIGVAAGPGDSSALLAGADAALYDAKRAGRNRVALARGTDDAPAGGRQRTAVSEEATPRHLRTMLAVSRAAASGRGEIPALEVLAQTIRSELSFGVVAVNLLDEARRELRVVVVLGDEDARQTLLDTVSPWSEWEGLLDSEHSRCGAIWLPAGSRESSTGTKLRTPAASAAHDPEAWHPEDMLLLPLRGAAGDVLGLVSLDQPLSGRRPEDAELTVLMAVADQAGLALEHAKRDSSQTAALREQSQELRLAAVMLLAETLDLRDSSTARHSRTGGAYARQTAEALGMAPDRVERIHAAGVLHDLGKLGIADAILYKPDGLDDTEWREIQRHPEIGARILEHAGLYDIASWVRAHHERIDGHGYPRALAAAEIPIEARILAVADAYEAMIADRPYRAGMPPDRASQELMRCAGTQFDGAVVRAFLDALERGGDVQRAQALTRAA